MHSFATLFSLLVLLGLSSAGTDIPEKILKKVMIHNSMEACWGKKNMMAFYLLIEKSKSECEQLSPTFDLSMELGEQTNAQASRFTSKNPTTNDQFEEFMQFWAFYQEKKRMMPQRRYRRAAAHTPDEAEIMEFISDVEEYKSNKKEKIGNLTCVLAKMGYLDADLMIDLKGINAALDMMPERKDPMFVGRLKEGYQDCYDISNAIPERILAKNPLTKKFGRQMIFFKCSRKVDISMCVKQQLLDWLEEWYGPFDAQKNERFGLPEDRYESSLAAMKVLMSNKSDNDKFISKFFFGKG